MGNDAKDTSHLEDQRDYANLARANGVVLSVGRKGECWDNAIAESFFATIKRELIDTRTWPTRTGLRAAMFDYLYRGLVQHPEASQLAWIPHPRRVRSHHPPQRRPPGGIINTTNLSVKARQLHHLQQSFYPAQTTFYSSVLCL